MIQNEVAVYHGAAEGERLAEAVPPAILVATKTGFCRYG